MAKEQFNIGTEVANGKSMSAEHISGNLHLYEAARTGFFAFIINPEEQQKLVRASYNGAKEAASTDDIYSNDAVKSYLKLNVVKCDIPHFEVQTLEYRRGNDVVKFAGVPTFNSGSIVVDDIVGLDTKGILMAWQALTYDVHTRKGGRMKDYKINCTLVEYTQDYEPIRQWQLYGCFPSSLSEGEFDRENDGKRQITATIQYDRAAMEEIGTANAD